MLEEFKKFAMRGNVVDLAVGVIIGAAFGKIVESLISMAHALDLSVTAEWVETSAQVRRLAKLGCDVGQGHWFGDPVPASRLDLTLTRPLAG